MKVALDPYMFRTTPLTELPGLVADLGYEYIELSPRDDFTPFFLHARANDDVVRRFPRPRDGRRRRVLQGRARRGGRNDRHAPAALPLVRTGRGRAAGGGPLLEARDRAHGGARLRRHQLPDQRPPRGGEREGEPVLALDGGAAAGLRARGRAAAARA